jgi:broad specificity phosphatase PhoE
MPGQPPNPGDADAYDDEPTGEPRALASPNATRILLLRHAETAAPERFHGAESDVALGEAGRLQAEAAARALARLRPDALYCSTMRRARETAAPIGRACGLDPRPLPRLHERRMGTLSGAIRAEVGDRYQETRRRWEAGDLDATHPGAESYRMIRDRVLGPFESLARSHPDRTAIVVAHGVVIRVLLCSLLPDAGPARFERFGIDFVAVNDLRWDGATWAAARLNAPPGELPVA